MADVRKLILHRIGHLGWSHYRVAQSVKGKVTAPTVYNFLAGRGEMKTLALGHLLKGIGLTIVPLSAPGAARRTPTTGKVRKSRDTGRKGIRR